MLPNASEWMAQATIEVRSNGIHLHYRGTPFGSIA